MTHSYLLEVGVEEMPAHVVTKSIAQLHRRVADFLKEERIDFDTIKEFATPRRLALLISGLADKQPDIDEEVKGPAKKIAQDADGNWTKAAQGFTRGQGVTVDDIEFKAVKGVEYVFVNKHVSGKPVAEVLTALPDVITAMNFPTLMKWGRHNLQFIRPIRWLVSLLDDEVVPFSILDVKAGRQTRGHRFLGHDVELKTATDYEAALKADFVIADQAKRKALIQEQIQKIVAANNWVLDEDLDLLEEVNNLVEWPTAFAGAFDEKYLVLPEEVLITSMRDNQRFFCVRDHEGKLLPHFISVRNGNAEHLDNVIKGNERVLVPRLEDAKFFYEEDQKISIDQYVERLQKVSFHDQISSMAQKMARTGALAQVLGQKLGFTANELADLKRASEIYKFDLTTQMVGEFAELQGVMGEIYANLAGEKAAVAQAIREHYLPISAEGELPTSKLGALLAIADKLDSIYSFFAVGLIPSGSNDPYALRRQAAGIMRILLAQGWHLPILNFQGQAAKAVSAQKLTFDYTKNSDQVRTFFLDRVKQLLSDEALRHDVIDAATDTKVADPVNIVAAAKLLAQHQDDEGFKDQIEALTRVIRIAKKAPANLPTMVDENKFVNPSEGKLHAAVTALASQADQLSLADLLSQLLSLEPVITNYFDENMIMDKDEAIKNNRLAQLVTLADLTGRLGNLDQLIVK
ncbi:glycine--tRNA ligase subunit beta [Lactobacillus sp. 3B(2020)]|uniref:glycine--tRNA ligase subunit beta n=1 Tax=Lactobacillus sp. 3B(2020) TaxID=2695882 RepID=UPI0015DF827B|nr:glycine--tRNA ligase subunit beta [Lactobacillus sp. 3B(2020)]QLL70148.1 glycine--tRNA ligase subunit beta [Lactobacillus sp. 3B(2020)]